MVELVNEAYVKGILDDVVADSKRLSRDVSGKILRSKSPAADEQ